MKTKCNIFLAVLFLFSSVSFPQLDNLSEDRIIDLTYQFDSLTIFWPTEEGFFLDVEFQGMSDKGYFYSANKFCTAEHGGTHLDAPIHFYKDKNTVDEIPLKKLIGEGIIIDVSTKCAKNRDYRL
jgi:kynurenine formamidase